MKIDDFVTRRLSVRALNSTAAKLLRDDSLAQEIASVFTPAVVKFLPATLHLDLNTDGIVPWLDDNVTDGQLFLARLKLDGRLVGLLLLNPTELPDETIDIHVGYLFSEDMWGRGLATELLRHLVDAVEGVEHVRLVAGVSPENKASARALEKAGFRSSDELSTGCTDVHVYVPSGEKFTAVNLSQSAVDRGTTA